MCDKGLEEGERGHSSSQGSTFAAHMMASGTIAVTGG